MRLGSDGYVLDERGKRARCECPEGPLDEDATRDEQDRVATEWAQEIARSLGTDEVVFVGVPEGRDYFLARVGEPVEI